MKVTIKNPSNSKQYPGVVAHLVACFILSIFTAGTINGQIHSQASGDWYTAATWDCVCIPTAVDDVIIHHAVTYTGVAPNTTAEANSITIINDSGVTASLNPSGGTLTIGNGGIVITGTAALLSSFFRSTTSSIVVINGDITITSAQADNFVSRFILDNNAHVTINGNFNYWYQPTDAVVETITEIGTNNTSTLIINGSVNLSYNSATKNSTLSFLMESSSQVTVTGSITLSNEEAGTLANAKVALVLGSSTIGATCALTIDGDLIMNNNDITSPLSNTLAFSTQKSSSAIIGGDIVYNYEPAVTQANANRVRVQNSSNLTLSGDILFSSNIAGTTNNRFDLENTATLNFEGNVLNSAQGRITCSVTSWFKFTGNSAQVIPSVLPNYGNIEVNNSSGVPLTLASSTSFSGTLNMTNGILDPVTSDRFILSSSATTNGGNVNSYVINGLTKMGSTSTVLPIGDDNQWAPVRIDNITGASDFFTAFSVIYHGSAHATTTTDGTFDHVSGAEYWNVSIVSAPGTGQPPTPPTSADVTFYWKDACLSEIEMTSDSPQDLYMARFNSSLSRWERLTSTINPGSESCGVGTAQGDITVSLGSAETDYTQFAFAAINSFDNPLPIELVSFNAITYNKIVAIDWKTSSELNNEKFMLQRSNNAKTWTSIYEIAGLGTTSTGQAYEYIDVHPFPGKNYYRLIQYDFDGSTSYSVVRVTTVDEQENEISFSIYPNPFVNELSIQANNINGLVKLHLYTLNGKLIQTLTLMEASFKNICFQEHIPKGIYQLVLVDSSDNVIGTCKASKVH